MSDVPTPAAADDDADLVAVSVGDRADGVATVTIDRPEARNALNGQVRAELKTALRACEAADEVRVVVLTGSEAAGAFVAGADVTEFQGRGPIEQRAESRRPRVYEVVEALDVPVIARINGHCLGGGNELALACDVRLADEDARIGQPEINLGLIPGGGATQRLPRVVGEGQAMRLVLSGEIIDGEEAADIGMVEAALPAPALDERVYELAGRMADKSAVALAYGKRAVQAAGRMDIEDGIEFEMELFLQLFASADKEEGIAAFLEDRDPEWEGK